MRRGCPVRPLRRPGHTPGRPSEHADVWRAWTGEGFTVIELLFVLGVSATLCGVAVPGVTHALSRYRTSGAVRAVRSALQKARASAVARGANVALRFSPEANGVHFTTFVDGNRNGVSQMDIGAGLDPEIEAAQSLAEFPGASFGIWPGVTAPDGGSLPIDDPIRVGPTSMVSFSPSGGCTSGTLYIRGPGGLQYAVRVFGDTGKTQVLRYVTSARTWVSE